MVKLTFCDTLGKQSLSDEELNVFIDKAGDIEEELLPTKQHSAKLKEDLTHCNSYHKYLKDYCFEGLYAFQVR